MENRQWYQEAYGEFYLTFLRPKHDYEARAQRVISLMNLRDHSTVLDLCCGEGRHAVPIAKQGFHVVGLDINPVALRMATEYASKERVSVDWFEGDMRHIPCETGYDGIYCIGYTFGCLETDDDNQAVLNSAARALKPEGRLLLQIWPHDAILRGGVDNNTFTPSENGDILLQYHEFHPISRRWTLYHTMLHRDGKRNELFQSYRLYTVAEISSMLKSAGFLVESIWGGFNEEPYELDSGTCVITARRS